ncbi:GNAT family N-acetyltransferase [Flavobacterium sp. CYK-4]|uniref:GNAT family N-acetyltransferase n=1 Tax=Flavobacterium lotistagni TaxID=2709660 RepID=UPI001407BA01|nr:GNAT family N-acetyltransferase [Flavobacterium lotistagni]NHM06106.1 GNAT family N-acetyltransferase [Flavobacterium lotistagni]
MSLNWKIKPFAALSADELYDLLQLRETVFIVEQNCIYHDIDSKDRKALHLIGEENAEIVAYARLFDAGDYFQESSIGRVVVKPEYRHKKIGHELMQEAIQAIAARFHTNQITISAQLYLKKFYESHGFIALGEVYLEDDIEHIRMKKK